MTQTAPSTEGRRKGGRPDAAARLAIDQRREQVSALLLSHISYRRIADLLGVSLSVIANDVAALRAAYRARAGADYDDHVAEEFAKLDVLEQAWLPKALPFHPLATPEAAAAAEKAANIVLRIQERKARLLGLDRPVRTEAQITVTTTSALDSEIETLLDQMRSEHESA